MEVRSGARWQWPRGERADEIAGEANDAGRADWSRSITDRGRAVLQLRVEVVKRARRPDFGARSLRWRQSASIFGQPRPMRLTLPRTTPRPSGTCYLCRIARRSRYPCHHSVLFLVCRPLPMNVDLAQTQLGPPVGLIQPSDSRFLIVFILHLTAPVPSDPTTSDSVRAVH